LSEENAKLNQVFATVYAELHAMAHRQLQRNRRSTALDTTSLVHDVYVRFASGSAVPVEDRKHFLGYCAAAMRSVVVDMVRAQLADKRGAGVEPITLNTGVQGSIAAAGDQIIKIHEALLELKVIDAELVKIVEMRYFAGMTHEEIAEATSINVRTVRRHWQKARAFLKEALAESP
jgi:RNA polymerase sigma factor (TIGR02999 family)